MTPAVLLLGGLDPSGGAGLLADAEAVRAAGGRPLACATALTVQTTSAVRSVHPVEPALVLAQVRALVEEERIGAVKLGMLGSAEVAAAVATLATGPLGRVPWVIDPVLRASSGARLVEGVAAYAGLLPLAALLTPNLAEAAALSGLAQPEDEAAMRACALALLSLGSLAVLLKGGHLTGEAVDLLVTAGGVTRFAAPRQPRTRRGTGCRLASFVAARLASGEALETAVAAAKSHVLGYLSS